MSSELIAFYIFAGIALMAAMAVISFKNPVHSVLSLVLTFFSTACLWLLLQAQFLGIVLILVYIGAVMILFLFVVMMLDVQDTPKREGLIAYFPVALLVAIVMLTEIIFLLGVGSSNTVTMTSIDPALVSNKSNIEWIGEALFSRYMLPFEVAAVILTVAVIIAILLTLRRRVGTKTQDPSVQVLVKKADRIRLIKMPAEIMPADSNTEHHS